MIGKKLFSAVLATLVILSIVAGSSIAFAQQTTVPTTTTTATTAQPTTIPTQPTTIPTQPTTIPTTANAIIQILASDPDFSTLVSLLTQANLTQTLNNTNATYTVLAPDNAAFAKLNNTTLANLKNNTPQLTQILLNHVIQGKANFTANGTVTTLAGNAIYYTANGTKVQFINGYNATITQANINATNGIIDVIDGVLIPPAQATASATAGGGFLGLPGFEALYAVAGLLAVAYLVIRRRK